MRETPYIHSIPRQFPWVLGLAIVMAVTGPFGSYGSVGLGVRLVYFGATGVLIGLQVLGFALLLSQVEAFQRWSIAARMALGGALAAIPGTVEIIVLHSWLVRPTPFRAALEIYPQTAFLTVAISMVIGLFIEQRLHADADDERARVAALPAADEPKDAAPDFFRRVPPALGRDLLALEMEDHYLRIHTALGSDLILLRLRDALAELGPPAAGRCIARGGSPRARSPRPSATAPAPAGAAQRPARAGQQDLPRPGQAGRLAWLRFASPSWAQAPWAPRMRLPMPPCPRCPWSACSRAIRRAPPLSPPSARPCPHRRHRADPARRYRRHRCLPASANYRDVVVPALEAGKHVFCESPLALDLEQARYMRDTARHAGRLLQVGLPCAG